MRYYSDELKKFFDSEKECRDAELKAKEAVERNKVTKASMAKAVEEADKQVELAYEELEQAKAKVKELQKKYDAEVDSIMNPVMETINKRVEDRTKAIQEFNKKFGVYTTTYSGNKAINEFLKTSDVLDSLWRSFYYKF